MNAQKHTSLSSATSEQTFIAGDYSISISHAASHNSSLFSNVEPVEVFQTDYSAQTSPRLSLQNLAVSTDAEQEQPPHPLIAKINSVLVSALRKAMEAVTADHGGRFPFALQSYQECIVSLKQALNLKPLRLDNDDTDGINTSSKERQRILELVAVYSDRIQCLQSLVWEAQKIALMPDWQLEELPLSGNNCTAMNSNDQCRRNGQYELMRMEVAPKWLEHRVYWLLRQLRRSIMEGAPLTPNLYIPKEVWYVCVCTISGGICVHTFNIRTTCVGFWEMSNSLLLKRNLIAWKCW
jgi:hypothetical protein